MLKKSTDIKASDIVAYVFLGIYLFALISNLCGLLLRYEYPAIGDKEMLILYIAFISPPLVIMLISFLTLKKQRILRMIALILLGISVVIALITMMMAGLCPPLVSRTENPENYSSLSQIHSQYCDIMPNSIDNYDDVRFYYQYNEQSYTQEDIFVEYTISADKLEDEIDRVKSHYEVIDIHENKDSGFTDFIIQTSNEYVRDQYFVVFGYSEKNNTVRYSISYNENNFIESEPYYNSVI